MTTGMETAVRPAMPAAPAGAAARSGGFGGMLSRAIEQVEGVQREAAGQVDRVLAGESGDLHGAILATQKAELTFELFSQVRNKVVQAYQEVMRMQV